MSELEVLELQVLLGGQLLVDLVVVVSLVKAQLIVHLPLSDQDLVLEALVVEVGEEGLGALLSHHHVLSPSPSSPLGAREEVLFRHPGVD